MNKKIWVIVAIFVLVAGGVFIFVKKSHRYMMHGKDTGKILEYMADKAERKLDLTAGQKIELDQLVELYTPRFDKARENHRKAVELFLNDFTKEKMSRMSIEASLKKAGLADLNAHGLYYEFLSEFHAILTPEQRKKLSDKIIKHMEHHRKK